ncbi:MAG: Hpt domain-containing protein [Myxococcales bacterium]|nr:Hpt domain-containing protein [Myxococcales bacterium]
MVSRRQIGLCPFESQDGAGASCGANAREGSGTRGSFGGCRPMIRSIRSTPLDIVRDFVASSLEYLHREAHARLHMVETFLEADLRARGSDLARPRSGSRSWPDNWAPARTEHSSRSLAPAGEHELDRLDEAVVSGDLHQVRVAAHRIAGLAANFGAHGLEALARELEGKPEHAELLVRGVQDRMRLTSAALDAIYRDQPPPR